MAPTKKSIYRQQGAQHFQLVHRSVRDPLINDPEASQQVFKPLGRANDSGKTGYTLAELEQSLDKSKIRANEGEAAGFGIAYDDSAYDYMQHLKTVGEGGGAVESVMLAAPRGSGVAPGMKGQANGKASKRGGLEDMFQLPAAVKPSSYEMSYAEAQASKEAIPRELQGLQPDMDPHLRQVLEALEDDAFVDDNGDDEDVFGALLGSGELDEWDETPEFEFAEWGVAEEGEDDDDDDARTEKGDNDDDDDAPPREETWEDRYRAFKAAGGRPNVAAPVSNGGWDEDKDAAEAAAERSEMADTLGSMVSGMGDLMVRGGKKRHGKRGPSDASGMSMSSASVYRNNNLRTLDARFDRLEREYELEDDDDEWCGDEDDDDVSIAPSYMSSASRVSMFSTGSRFTGGDIPEVTRDDFESIMDDFLENYEVVGKRLRAAVGGTSLSGPEKLNVLRRAVEGDGEEAAENRRRILEIERMTRGPAPKEDEETYKMKEVVPEKEKWDVESILSTYTNTENHPGTIRLRSTAESKERARRRAEQEAAIEAASQAPEAASDDSGSETEREDTPKVTVSRKKGESTEERKARKAAVKNQRAGRRAEKKAHTETFTEERKRQINSHKKAVAGGRAADLSVQRNVISL